MGQQVVSLMYGVSKSAPGLRNANGDETISGMTTHSRQRSDPYGPTSAIRVRL